MKGFCSHCNADHDYLETAVPDGRGHSVILPLRFYGQKVFVKDSRLYMEYYDPLAQQHPEAVCGFGATVPL